MKQHAEAAYQMATYLHLRGDAGSALSQIDAGLRIADLSKQERARLLARRQEIRDSLPKDWRPPSGSEPRG
jgi:beta-barrel assembly-enhancing protease